MIKVWTSSLAIVACLVLFASFPGAALSGGAAQRDITPPVGGAMYGYAARGNEASVGIHDALYARALVLRDTQTHVVIVALDLGSFPGEAMDRVRAAVKQEAGLEHLLFAVSHSHSAGVFQRDFPSADAPWLASVESRVIEAILEGAANTVHVRLSVGRGTAEEGHNRRLIGADGKAEMLWGNPERIPTSPVDHEVTLMRVEKEDGTTLANLVGFSCHPVILGPDNLQISADYVGVMARHVEEHLGGHCLFLQGACGDINPFGDKTPIDQGAFEEVARMGRVLADEVVRVSANLTPVGDGAALSFHSETVSLAPRRQGAGSERWVDAEINTLAIGDRIAFATFPGEFFVEHALSLKERSKFPYTYFVGYCNGALGYFPTINACVEGGYGADVGVRTAPGAGEHLVNRALINLYRQTGRIR